MAQQGVDQGAFFGRESLAAEVENEPQGGAALDADPDVLGDGVGLGAGGRTHGVEGSGTASVGEDSEVPDAVQCPGQAMEEEAPDEGVGVECHGAVGGILGGLRDGLAVAHGDGVTVEGDDSGIGDGGPVGVAGEVVDDGRGSVEGPISPPRISPRG